MGINEHTLLPIKNGDLLWLQENISQKIRRQNI